MINVLGLDLAQATRRLTDAGFAVQTAQLAPKKPKPGDACRVVRQRLLDDGVVLLDWAEFRTEVVSNRE